MGRVLHPENCFQLGNGDCGGDAALMAAWLKRKGYERVAVLNEVSPNGEEYFERIRFLASNTGGPRTHIACSPYDHKMFKGDWLLYGKIEGEKLQFEGYFEPE